MEFRYFDNILQARKAYARALEPVCKAWDLTHNEVDILLFLYNTPKLDRAADIVSRRGIAKSHVSLSVADLEARGLLTRHCDPEDRRTVRLELTDQGQTIADAGRMAQDSFFRKVFVGLSSEELAQWRQILEKVVQNIHNLVTI